MVVQKVSNKLKARLMICIKYYLFLFKQNDTKLRL